MSSFCRICIFERDFPFFDLFVCLFVFPHLAICLQDNFHHNFHLFAYLLSLAFRGRGFDLHSRFCYPSPHNFRILWRWRADTDQTGKVITANVVITYYITAATASASVTTAAPAAIFQLCYCSAIIALFLLLLPLLLLLLQLLMSTTTLATAFATTPALLLLLLLFLLPLLLLLLLLLMLRFCYCYCCRCVSCYCSAPAIAFATATALAGRFCCSWKYYCW